MDDDRPTLGYVTVRGGAYATVRAVEEAKRQFGEDATVAGIVSGIDPARSYTYRVVPKRQPTCRGCGGPEDGHYPDCLPASQGGTQPDVVRLCARCSARNPEHGTLCAPCHQEVNAP